jgi:hypothetical protein
MRLLQAARGSGPPQTLLVDPPGNLFPWDYVQYFLELARKNTLLIPLPELIESASLR